METDDVRKLYSHFDGNDSVTVFEKYKYLTEHDADIVKFKEKVSEIVCQKQLSSAMNDTKWIELQCAIDTLPFPPAYHEKLITFPKDYPVGTFVGEPNYFGNWSSYWEEGLPLFFNIEWLKVRPRYSKFRGRLVAPEILDETKEFEAILKKYTIPYEEDNGTFVIYGYK